MSAERFTLDANVLVYAADLDSGWKHERALDILDRASERDCVLTLQALGEFFFVTTRKGIVANADATALVNDWLTIFPSVTNSMSALRAAMMAVMKTRLGFWDAMLLATTGEAGCSVVLSEDMRDGARFGGVTVRNPFAGDSLPKDIRDRLGLE